MHTSTVMAYLKLVARITSMRLIATAGLTKVEGARVQTGGSISIAMKKYISG